MPKVRFVGGSNKYIYGSYVFKKPDNLVHEVSDEDWTYLRKQRGFVGKDGHAGGRVFVLDDTPDEEMTYEEQVALGVEARSGTFPTKSAAVSYAQDVFGVQLSDLVSIDQLNAAKLMEGPDEAEVLDPETPAKAPEGSADPALLGVGGEAGDRKVPVQPVPSRTQTPVKRFTVKAGPAEVRRQV